MRRAESGELTFTTVRWPVATSMELASACRRPKRSATKVLSRFVSILKDYTREIPRAKLD
jgi:hypothetical protein